MTTTEVKILQTHLNILTHEHNRDPDDDYLIGSLTELRSIIEQTGGKIVDGIVTYDS